MYYTHGVGLHNQWRLSQTTAEVVIKKLTVSLYNITRTEHHTVIVTIVTRTSVCATIEEISKIEG